MKRTSFLKAVVIISAVFALSGVQTSEAALQQIANWSENGTGEFFFTNNSPVNASFFTTPGGGVYGGVAVTFSYKAILDPILPAALQGSQNAHIFVNSVTTAPVGGVPPNVVQNMNGVSNQILIYRDTPYGGSSNLLSVVFTGNFAGQTGDGSIALQGSTTGGDTVVFTSDFMTFVGSPSTNVFSVTVNPISPTVNTSGSFLRGFSGDGTGSFSADPVLIPEPGSSLLMVLGLAGLVAARRRR